MRPVNFLVFMFGFLHRMVKNSLLVFGICTVCSDFSHGAAKSLFFVFVSFQVILFRIKILCHRGNLILSVPQSLFGYGIVSRRAERLTAKNAHCREQRSYKKAALLKCLYCICRAGWGKPTGRSALERREILLVKTNEPYTQVLHVFSFCWNISSLANPRRNSLSTSVDLMLRMPSLGATTIKNPVLSSGSTAR